MTALSAGIRVAVMTAALLASPGMCRQAAPIVGDAARAQGSGAQAAPIVGDAARAQGSGAQAAAESRQPLRARFGSVLEGLDGAATDITAAPAAEAALQAGRQQFDRAAPRWANSGVAQPPPPDADPLDRFLAERNVPPEKRPAVRKQIDDVWHLLSTVGIALGDKSSLDFRVGDWWATDNRTVYLPLREILENADKPQVLIGGVAHEAGHVYWSRFTESPFYDELIQKMEFPAAAHNLFNLLEDDWQETAHAKKWPGLRPYHKRFHEHYRPDLLAGDLLNGQGGRVPERSKAKPGQLLPHEEYLEFLRKRWMTGKFPPVEEVKHEDARKAAAATQDSVSRLLARLPKESSPSEHERIVEAHARMRHIEREILPHYQKLLEKSRDQLTQPPSGGQSQNQRQGQGQQGQGQGQQGQGQGQQEQGQQRQGQGQQAQGQQGQGQGQQGQGQQRQGQGQPAQGPQQGQGHSPGGRPGQPASAAEQAAPIVGDAARAQGSGAQAARQAIESRAQEIGRRYFPTHGNGPESGRPLPPRDSVSVDPAQRQREADGVDRSRGNESPGSTARPGHGVPEIPEIVERLLDQNEKVAARTTAGNDYESNITAIHHLIDNFAGRLENLFAKNSRTTWEGPYTSGRKVNKKRWLSSEARGWRQASDFKVFERKRLPTRRDYAFRLLIDLSGSMGGANHKFALQTTILFMEVLERLGIGFSVMGFDTKVYVFKDFDADAQSKKTLSHEEKVELIDSVTRTGGGSTWDTEAVITALKGGEVFRPDNQKSRLQALEDQPGEGRYLFVITDGEGNGSASSRLADVLAEASAKQVAVIGVGVGDGMAYVQKRYPRYVLEPTLSTVPEKMGDLLEDIIQEELRR